VTKFNDDGTPKGYKNSQIAGMMASFIGLEADIKRLNERAPTNQSNELHKIFYFVFNSAQSFTI
jgi:hypothetical protein